MLEALKFSVSWCTVQITCSDILVICPASHKGLIHEAIWRSDESSPSFSRLSITLEGLDDAEAASLDTGDILRKFAERFIVSLLDRHSDSRNSGPNHATYFDT